MKYSFLALFGAFLMLLFIKASVVAIVAEGDLVMLSFVREMPDPVDKSKKYTTTWFDLFRIENGKIAEHWDSAEKMKPN
jgi:predicted SnoaL-like aldol condensation-catalyzing enzyme